MERVAELKKKLLDPERAHRHALRVHSRATGTHRRAADLHEAAANLQATHAAEMHELGRTESAERAEGRARRERQLAHKERQNAEQEEARSANG